MIAQDPPPSRFERAVLSIPDGAVLRGIFFAIIALTGWVLYQDFEEIWQAERDAARVTRTDPLPLRRPAPGDQRRPYLPRTMPLGPERGVPVLPGHGPVEGETTGEPMVFVRQAGSSDISAIGRIDPGTAGQLEAFLSGEGEGATVLHLHSPGGSVLDAIAMARTIRAAELETVVPADGYCASACPLVFSGGARRSAGQNAWIGVHQVYAAEVESAVRERDVDRSISDIQSTSADAQDLLIEMGVDPRLWIHAMRTPPRELYVLTPEELSEFDLVTPPEGEEEDEEETGEEDTAGEPPEAAS